MLRGIRLNNLVSLLGLKEKTPESLIVLKKDLTEMRDRKAERERVSSQAMATDANKVRHMPCDTQAVLSTFSVLFE